MREEIFRKTSLDKVKSPENLDDYIRVSNPGVWLLLVSIIILLAGAFVWGIFGRIDSTAPAEIYAEGGKVVCFAADEDISSVHEGMTVRFEGYEAVITEIGKKEAAGYVCSLQSNQTIPDGYYEGRIIIKSIRPVFFILN